MARLLGLVGFRVKAHAEGEGEPASSQQAVGRKEKGTKRKRYAGGDPPDKKDLPKDMIVVEGEYMDFEGYCGVREFVFLHYFSGEEDRLGDAVKEEAARLGLKVTACSADIKKGHDLGADKPFKSHYYGYHSGFPCNTYTKLRWRPLPGHPGPLRSKEEPYGFRNLTPDRKAEVDRGTIYMARSVDMVKAMEEGHKDMMVKGFATLENPPPSDHPKHISAWHMPERWSTTSRTGSRHTSTPAPMSWSWKRARGTTSPSWWGARCRACKGSARHAPVEMSRTSRLWERTSQRSPQHIRESFAKRIWEAGSAPFPEDGKGSVLGGKARARGEIHRQEEEAHSEV